MRKALLIAGILLLLAGTAVFAKGGQEAPLGSEDNPIVWAFVPSGEMEQVSAGADEMAKLLHNETGLYFKTTIATEYAGVIEALASNPPKAQMASLATFSYIKAADMGVAEAVLVAVRYGSPVYNGQIITRADSGINTLQDLMGKTFARPDPLSTSGWIIPMITMRAAGINPDTDLKQIVDAGGHPAVVTAVYNGDADAGATFIDARSSVQDQHPDVMDVIKVISVSEDIPNDGVQFAPSVPDDIKAKIVAALLKIASTDEGKAALKKAYSWDGLIAAQDDFYDPFRQVLQASGLKVEDLE